MMTSQERGGQTIDILGFLKKCTNRATLKDILKGLLQEE